MGIIMKKEDKELLLKDLCARLYTDTVVNYNDTEGCDYKLTIRTLSNFPEEKLKCYLRPMSSMTKEEREHFFNTCIYLRGELSYWWTCESYDWLNEHHFDYRGLIEMGLALEAHEGMYKENKI